jgi:hypothetical protein
MQHAFPGAGLGSQGAPVKSLIHPRSRTVASGPSAAWLCWSGGRQVLLLTPQLGSFPLPQSGSVQERERG